MDEIDPKKPFAESERSSAPPNWPDMPARSGEHEQEPPTRREGEAPADVTEAQRDLERRSPTK